MSANGYLTPSELTSIGNGLSLRTDAAKSFLAMAAVALSEGVQINWPGTAGAYRPWAMQLDMRVHPERYGINPFMNALPGLPSSHGTGLARDVPFGAPNNWMIANAAKFGWTRPARTLKLNDLNHWEFTPGTATASLDITPTAQEDDMPSLKRIIFDEGDNTKPGYASTAIYNETTGFVKTSDGYGLRGEMEAYTAIGGVLGFNITEVHVNADGWTLAQLFTDRETAATVDITALAKELAAAIGKDLADVTADEIAARLAQ